MLIYLKILIKIKFLVEICKPKGGRGPCQPPLATPLADGGGLEELPSELVEGEGRPPATTPDREK
jgi:hypothetical protein